VLAMCVELRTTHNFDFVKRVSVSDRSLRRIDMPRSRARKRCADNENSEEEEGRPDDSSTNI